MSNLTDFLGSSKPKLITRYTSGTGTYIPTADNARCFIRIQAGGGGGSTSPQVGGGGGAMGELFARIPIAGWMYNVGAGGAINANGSPSYFGPFSVMGGYGGNATPFNGMGGVLSILNGSVDADGASIVPGNGLQGYSGGGGGYAGSYQGLKIGFPLSLYMGTGFFAPSANAIVMGNGYVGGGGDSFYGYGGPLNTSPAATAYGAGGGSGTTAAAGAGGCIEIWDYGA